MRRLWDDTGTSVADLVVAAAMGLLVLSILSTALFAVFRADSRTEQDSVALAELRTGSEKLVRELRQAAKVYTEAPCFGTTPPAEVPADEWKRRLWFWIDADRDGLQDPVERIEWRLRPTEAGKAELVRRTDADLAETYVGYSQHLLDGEAFECNVAPPETDLVEVTFVADVDTTRYAAARKVRTEITLRNVPD